VHGGPEKAVCVYSAEHRDAWREETGLDLPPGAFGENFTVSGQDETNVAVGDVFAVGGAVVEVSQPRGPCWKLARRWARPDLPKRVLATRRTGWYLRVLEEGPVAAGDELLLRERRAPEWTIARVVAVKYFADEASPDFAALAACASLPRPFRAALRQRIAAALSSEEPA